MVNDKTKRKSPAKSLPKKNLKNKKQNTNKIPNLKPNKKQDLKSNKKQDLKPNKIPNKKQDKDKKIMKGKTGKEKAPSKINKKSPSKTALKKTQTQLSKSSKKTNLKINNTKKAPAKKIIKKKKKVIFSPKATLKTYNQEPESVGCILNQPLQQLLRSCHITHERIANIINRESSHSIFKPIGDNSLKVFDTGSNWWNDNSPNILLEKLYDQFFLRKFLYLIDYHIRRNQKIGETKRLEIKNNRFKIVFHQILRKV